MKLIPHPGRTLSIHFTFIISTIQEHPSRSIIVKDEPRCFQGCLCPQAFLNPGYSLTQEKAVLGDPCSSSGSAFDLPRDLGKSSPPFPKPEVGKHFL